MRTYSWISISNKRGEINNFNVLQICGELVKDKVPSSLNDVKIVVVYKTVLLQHPLLTLQKYHKLLTVAVIDVYIEHNWCFNGKNILLQHLQKS